MRSIPDLAALDEVVTCEVARVSGWEVTPAIMLDIARGMREVLGRGEVSGVVVTHGTDTVEETAFICDLLLDSPQPALFTGAMRSLDAREPDGPHNLHDALRAASCAALESYGAIVAMSGELHAARWVQKMHSHRTSAFSSPERGPVARLSADAIALMRPPPRRVTFPLPDHLPTVAVANAYTGADPKLIEAILDATAARGLVVEGTGLGNLPAELVPGIERLVATGIPVVVASRVASGGTKPLYGGPGGGANLRSVGVLEAGDLPAGKARLLLGVLLGLGLREGELRKSFADAVEHLR